MEWCLTFNWLCQNQSGFLNSLLPNFWQSIRFDSSSDSFYIYTDWPLPDFCQLIRFIFKCPFDWLLSKSYSDLDLSKDLTDFRWLLKSIEYALVPSIGLYRNFANSMAKWLVMSDSWQIYYNCSFVYNSTDWPLPDFCHLIRFISLWLTYFEITFRSIFNWKPDSS